MLNIERNRRPPQTLWVALIVFPLMVGLACSLPGGATPTPSQPAPPTATQLPLGVLSLDDFKNPDTGWPTETGEGFKIGYHPPDFYHIEVSVPNKTEAVLFGPVLGDVTIETDVLVEVSLSEVLSGDFRYGLAARGSDAQYYAFTISPVTQQWQVAKQTEAGQELLAEGVHDGIAGLTAPDRLRVDVAGPQLTFHINEQPVVQLEDSAFSTGSVGLIVQTLDATKAHIHYDELVVREVETVEVAQIATPTTAAPTATLAPTEEPTPEPTATVTAVPIPEGMLFIPGGTFNMGSDQGRADERPVHQVTLSDFYLDQYEVTNARYQACVADGGCTPPLRSSGFTRSSYFDNPDYANYPVVFVNWEQAEAFCAWEARRLPTEAEWEYAASGGDGTRFPWGNDFDADLLPARENDTAEVGSYPAGASPFGVHDMAGNVLEWVADRYSSTYYGQSPPENPTGPDSGGGRVFRGGSFGNTDGSFYTTTRRYNQGPRFATEDLGFRCAADAP